MMYQRIPLFVLGSIVAFSAAIAEPMTLKVDGCDFSVDFPDHPTVTQMYSGEVTFKRVELLTSSSVLRAECIPFKFRDQDIIAGLQAQAVGDGLNYETIQLLQNGVYELRGYKSIQGRPAIYVLRAHSGASSFLGLMVATASEDYPTTETSAFLASVRDVD